MSTPKIEPWILEAADELCTQLGVGAYDELSRRRVAAIIARHAKSEGVNEKLLAAAKHLRVCDYPDEIDHRCDDCVLAGRVIAFAESAPASLERELAKANQRLTESHVKLYRERDDLAGALREIVDECPNPKLPYGVRVVEIARAVLRKYDEAKIILESS